MEENCKAGRGWRNIPETFAGIFPAACCGKSGRE